MDCDSITQHTEMPRGFASRHYAVEDLHDAGYKAKVCDDCGRIAIWEKDGTHLASWKDADLRSRRESA